MDQEEKIETSGSREIEISLDQTFYPFDGMHPDDFRNKGQSPTYVIPNLCKIVFRFSEEVPSATGRSAKLKNDLYIWAELAVDTSVPPEDIEKMAHDLSLSISLEGSAPEIIGIPEINEMGDRFTFNHWGEIRNPEGQPIETPRSYQMILPIRQIQAFGAKIEMPSRTEFQRRLM